MVCGPNHRVDARAIGQTWIFEQTELELEREQARHGVVQQTLVEQTFAYRRDGTLIEARGRHDQVIAGLDGIGRRHCVVRLDVLLPHGTAHIVPIGHQRAAILPFAAQLAVQQPIVERDRRAID